MCEIMPERSFKRMRANRIVVHKAAHALLETKREQMAEQKGADDLLSLLGTWFVSALTMKSHLI